MRCTVLLCVHGRGSPHRKHILFASVFRSVGGIARKEADEGIEVFVIDTGLASE